MTARESADSPEASAPIRVPRLSLGEVCRQVRRSRDLRQADVARLAGIPPSTVLRLEEGRMPEPRTFSSYVGVLCGPEAVGPLTAQQATFLWRCFAGARNAPQTEAAFAGVTLRDITRRGHARELACLVSALQAETYPAYIRDELFFLHAMNGPLLQIFDTANDHPFLSTWACWHSIGSALAPDSTVTEAHTGDTYVPSLVRYLLRASVPHLFTLQMSALVERLCQMSPDAFATWWRAALSLLLPEPPEALPRTVQAKGDLLQATIQRIHTVRLEIAPGYTVRYSLGAWRPQSAATDSVLRGLSTTRARQEVLFAATYDQDGTFHVNEWPEARREWERRVAQGEV